MMNRRGMLAVAVALAGLSATPGAAAQEVFPSRPVRLIVPFPPGGPTDIAGRILATELEKTFGHNVIVDNRAGAASVIGTEAVVRSKPDGYTLLFGSNSTFSVNPVLMKDLSFNVTRDLRLIGLAAQGPQALVVRKDLPAQTVREVIALAKAKPGALTIASSGSGSIIHLAGELFRHRAGIETLHVPYRGGGPAVQAMLAGESDMMVNDLSPVLSHVKAGTLRVLAIASPTRVAALPEVPTFAEAGLPGVESFSWFGLAAPAGTPAPILERITQALESSLKAPEYRDQLAKLGLEPATMRTAETQAFIESEIAKWDRLVTEAKVTVQ